MLLLSSTEIKGLITFKGTELHCVQQTCVGLRSPGFIFRPIYTSLILISPCLIWFWALF